MESWLVNCAGDDSWLVNSAWDGSWLVNSAVDCSWLVNSVHMVIMFHCDMKLFGFTMEEPRWSLLPLSTSQLTIYCHESHSLTLRHNESETQWLWDTMSMRHNDSETQWVWDTKSLRHNDSETQWLWDTMSLRHNTMKVLVLRRLPQIMLCKIVV